MQPRRGPPGTKDKPLEVMSMFDEQIIGCVCTYLQISALKSYDGPKTGSAWGIFN